MMSGAKIVWCKDGDEWCKDGDRILSFAPGEGNRPLGIFMYKDSEFLSFPTIYCGKRQADNSERRVPVHYSTMCKWELRSQDRRVAMFVPNIFYKLKNYKSGKFKEVPVYHYANVKLKVKRTELGT